MQIQSQQTSRGDRPIESAPALLLAYAAYLVLLAISASTGHFIPSWIAFGAFLAITTLTSRAMTTVWRIYNGIAAALFFSSALMKPYGELHLHTVSQWGAALVLVVCALLSPSSSRRARTMKSKEESWPT
jgi:hypothetical protein